MLVDVSHVVEHGMITYKGLPAPDAYKFAWTPTTAEQGAPA
jgi:hypothetical protein